MSVRALLHWGHSLPSILDDPVPPGWSYNPSSWGERIPLVVLSVIGLGLSWYLAMNQLGLIPPVWDPFFGTASSMAVLHSVVDKYTIVPDAALGFLGYSADLVVESVGGRTRWRTMPWMVCLFGLTIFGLGMVSMLLMIVQGVVVNAWCTLCLGSAVVSTIVLARGFGEVLAALQHVQREQQAGCSAWRAFWGLHDYPRALA